MRAVVLALMVAACGRFGFGADPSDAPPAPIDAAPDATITGPCTGTQLFDDGFDDGQPGPVFQVFTAPDLTVVETGSRVEIQYMPTVAANHYAGYLSNTAYAVEGICAQVEVTAVGPGFEGAYFKLFTPSKVIEFFETGGEVIDFRTQLDMVVGYTVEVPFDAAAMRFWRFRVVSGVTYWDTSADGAVFVERAALPDFFAGVTARLEFGAGEDIVITDGTTASYAGALAFGP